MRKNKWPLIWLRRWDRRQEEESREKQQHREYSEDPRRDDAYLTHRIYPLIDHDR